MGILFQTRPGSVVALDDPAVQCTAKLLSFIKPNITFEVQRSIVTRVTVAQQGNVQFLHTLGNLVYIYAFGDRMGQVTLSGLSFTCPCPGGGDVGAEKMLQWYKANRVAKKKDPIRLSIGNEVIEGFVVGFSEDVIDPSLSLVQWGAQIAALPTDG